jgi:predicted nucleic acid-binding Zn ribbon protein
MSARRLIPARFRKKCPVCGEPIDEGDMIGLVDGEVVA